VCSPAFRDAHPDITQAAHLARLPLLHLQPTEPERWLAWNGWFEAQGLTSPPDRHGMTFNSYALVIHAVLMNQGVALGWTAVD